MNLKTSLFNFQNTLILGCDTIVYNEEFCKLVQHETLTSFTMMDIQTVTFLANKIYIEVFNVFVKSPSTLTLGLHYVIQAAEGLANVIQVSL
jgi:hypothetical protein